ncbi:hypothetical protein [Aeromicrobium fastidiosum]|uniref:Uncharacterized protein n=1 Tax=Aeromicrobium fastidiosum TaxID=52699 RepID=A0A641ATF1_9ACTN|nr:hypothetical protein [Aeromicrobium fastidiosum]KAA1380513.1 hypothetical protein ESP62_004875 [Aeromicrobium fastidiosum]MBP2390105.1 hypothetical protein [Aeromicrobium fastidiosum]
MDRTTSLKVWSARQDEEPLEARLARLAAAAPAPPVEGQAQTIPGLDPQVDIATLTKPELHDLVYAAASTYLQSLSSMTKTKAHLHAERIAHQALAITAGQDYMSRGADPRG